MSDAAAAVPPRPAATTPRAAIKRIIAEEAAAAGLAPADILGRARSRGAARARHAAMRRVRAAFPEMSTPAIGRIFNRNHTTVLYALGALARGRA